MVQCCFCGPVRQCGAFLPAVLSNIEKMGSQLFPNQYAIIIFYDKSTDNSLAILQKWKKRLAESKNNITLHLFINPHPLLSSYRTHRIALARNKCVDILLKQYPDCPYFAMMDFDQPNSKRCHVDKLHKYFNPDKLEKRWDSVSFQTAPNYYDIWALSIPPFSFSYNHFRNNDEFYAIIQKYMDKMLAGTNRLIPCISAFNGFAFYKTAKFAHCKYYGDIQTSIRLSKKISPQWISQHKHITNSSHIIFKDYGHVKGNAEDCEHRSFHMQAISKHGAKIRISPEIIFN